MAELEPCFKALGFTARPQTAEEVSAKRDVLLIKHSGSTATDQLARQLITENHSQCMALMIVKGDSNNE